MLKATPQRLGPWLVAAAATHKAAELRDPAHGLVKRGWLFRRCRTMMDGTIQCLPFLDVQQHVTRHLGDRPRQHDGIKHPPGNDAIERQAALQAFTRGQLARFDATATFQNPMPHLNAPATDVPRDAFDGVCCRTHLNRGQQQPLNGLDVHWRIDFTDLHGPQCHAGQALSLAMPGRAKRQRTKAQCQRGFAAGLRATTGHLQGEVLHNRLRRNRGPHIALGHLHTAVPRSSHQEFDTCRTLSSQQVKDIGFTVANADKARWRTTIPSIENRLKTGEPFLAFLLTNGQLLAPLALANVIGITGPHVLWTCRP